jgi:proline iminopeptidase
MFVDIGTAKIFFDTAGPEYAISETMVKRPTLIVMHGGPGFDHSTMRPYFDRFADTHHVLYIDHRGNGRSTGDPDTWTLAQWGDDVKAICDALGIEKPVVYGNSFGGMVAMSYAARHPAHPSKLILSSTSARMRLDLTSAIMEERGGKQASEIAERFWNTRDDQSYEDYMRVCMPLYNPPGANSAVQAAAWRRAVARPETGKHFSLGEMSTMDLRAGLSRVSCPTLVLAGTYDPITPVPCSEEIAAALPKGKAQLEVFEGAGHGVHRDQPEKAEKVLRAFFGGLS